MTDLVEPTNAQRAAGNGIRLAGFACALAAFWQIVRFWTGDVGLPGVDQVLAAASLPPLRPSTGEGVLGVFNALTPGLAGAVYWAGVGGGVSMLAGNIAFIVEHGWGTWRQACASQAAEARKRERLARLRQLRRQAREKRSGGSGLFALVAGIAIGVWLS